MSVWLIVEGGGGASDVGGSEVLIAAAVPWQGKEKAWMPTSLVQYLKRRETAGVR